MIFWLLLLFPSLVTFRILPLSLMFWHFMIICLTVGLALSAVLGTLRAFSIWKQIFFSSLDFLKFSHFNQPSPCPLCSQFSYLFFPLELLLSVFGIYELMSPLIFSSFLFLIFLSLCSTFWEVSWTSSSDSCNEFYISAILFLISKSFFSECYFLIVF